jgi:hypothetical protein
VSDSGRGDSKIASTEYKIDGGAWTVMAASDGAFDQVIESVAASMMPFTTAGVYDVEIRGTDAARNTGPAESIFLVIYNPEGGFVTGGGWINSPPGAYDVDQTLTGKATFGFVSKYQKGASIPTGQTEFQFHLANLNFHSESYQWLVVAGAKAQYKGTGTGLNP